MHAGTVKIRISEIDDSDRVRKKFEGIPELATSIEEVGLIQPIVITKDKKLAAGGRRLKAHQYLKREFIECVILETLSEAKLRQLEMEENFHRRDFTWQERVQGIAAAHAAKEADPSEPSWTLRQTAKLLGCHHSTIGHNLLLNKYLRQQDEEIWAASSANEAYNIILKRRETEINRELAKRRLNQPSKKVAKSKPSKSKSGPAPKTVAKGKTENTLNINVDVQEEDAAFYDNLIDFPEETSSSTSDSSVHQLCLDIRHADSKKEIKKFPDKTFDAIITDLPYAIDMKNLSEGMKEDVEEQHDVTENLELYDVIVPELYRILKDQTYFVGWCDVMNFRYLYDKLGDAGFYVQRWPLIWEKTSACQNRSSGCNSTKNFEVAIVARKGTATLQKHLPSSVFKAPNNAPKRFHHKFAKPEPLWEWVYAHYVPPYGKVLDPFMGVGSNLATALPLSYDVTGIEIVLDHYNLVESNIITAYAERDLEVEIELC